MLVNVVFFGGSPLLVGRRARLTIAGLSPPQIQIHVRTYLGLHQASKVQSRVAETFHDWVNMKEGVHVIYCASRGNCMGNFGLLQLDTRVLLLLRTPQYYYSKDSNIPQLVSLTQC